MKNTFNMFKSITAITKTSCSCSENANPPISPGETDGQLLTTFKTSQKGDIQLFQLFISLFFWACSSVGRALHLQ